MRGGTVPQLVHHCAAIADAIDLFGFYLQPAVGGIELPYEFWRGFCEIPGCPRNQDRHLRPLPHTHGHTRRRRSGRKDIALYTATTTTSSPTCSIRTNSSSKDASHRHPRICWRPAWTVGRLDINRNPNLVQCRDAKAHGANIPQHLLQIGKQPHRRQRRHLRRHEQLPRLRPRHPRSPPPPRLVARHLVPRRK